MKEKLQKTITSCKARKMSLLVCGIVSYLLVSKFYPSAIPLTHIPTFKFVGHISCKSLFQLMMSMIKIYNQCTQRNQNEATTDESNLILFYSQTKKSTYWFENTQLLQNFPILCDVFETLPLICRQFNRHGGKLEIFC